MIDAISKLVESGAISEDVQKSIQEAWDSKIKENKEQVGAELREEFAKRYEHDKANMIEAIDKMMSEKLSEEITKFVEDRKALAQEKIAYKENVGKHSGKLQEFIMQKLSEELFMKQKFLKVLLKWKDQLSQKDLRNYFPFQEYILHLKI